MFAHDPHRVPYWMGGTRCRHHLNAISKEDRESHVNRSLSADVDEVRARGDP
jgi:hypothetical protein